MIKKAIITGVTGQDGSYLSELLLSKEYEVYGLIRSSSTPNTSRIDHLIGHSNFHLHYGDVTDPLCINEMILNIKPDEVYNLAAQSHVRTSFDIPLYTAQVDALGVLNILEAVRKIKPECKIYQASTSELFGGLYCGRHGYNELSPFHPRSPYGVSKLYAYWIARNYREAYNMFVVNGILFNHESPRRTETFVTKKIVEWIKRYVDNKQSTPLLLGNLDSKRDWGHAKDYVNTMWMMLQYHQSEDWVVATGKTYSIREFVTKCFAYVDIELKWQKLNGLETALYNDELLICQDKDLFRPSEVNVLKGDNSKIKRVLQWEPEYDIDMLIKDMFEK